MIKNLLYKLFNYKSDKGDKNYENKEILYNKISLIIAIICFIWNAIVFKFLPQDLPMQFDTSTWEPTYTFPKYYGAWIFPIIILFSAILSKFRDKVNLSSVIIIGSLGIINIIIYGYLAYENVYL